MTDPRLVSDRFPYVLVKVVISGSDTKPEQELEFEAFLDTGFDGALAIPSKLIKEDTVAKFNLPWRLADGSRIRTPVYVVKIMLGDIGPIEILAIAIDSDPLLGREITDNFLITLDHGRKLIIDL